ncbi:MAG: hypothetical protein KatS3mg111_0553 [Pirellulaceae bacterium]|nr:MAG: hypothetical protein KatS3mg111_0553 [Pirellulaceae bacterium]
MESFIILIILPNSGARLPHILPQLSPQEPYNRRFGRTMVSLDRTECPGTVDTHAPAAYDFRPSVSS